MIAGIIVIVFIAVCLLPAILNICINDRTVPIADTVIEPGRPNKLLVLFPHPDDEVTVAGTLSTLKRNVPDLELILVYLTEGEAGPTGGLVTKQELGAVRIQEVKRAAGLLQADHLELFNLGDGKLVHRSSEEMKAIIRQLIQKYEPSSIITFDSRIGLYGHTDHRMTGLWTLQVFEEDRDKPQFPVTRLFCPTLPKPMLALALRFSKTFRERYPKHPEHGLPPAAVAVKITSQAAVKGAVIRAHQTQRQVMSDVQPLYDKVPAWLYYRIFDREYLALAAQK